MPDDRRFRLCVEQEAGGAPRIRIEDRTRGLTLLTWIGALARHLLQTGALPFSALRRAEYDCDKALIRHLTLAGAAAQVVLDQIAGIDALDSAPRSVPRLRTVTAGSEPNAAECLKERLEHAGRHLPGPHLLVAKTLFARRGEHFSVIRNQNPGPETI